MPHPLLFPHLQRNSVSNSANPYNIGATARQDGKLDRQTVNGGDYLHPHTKEILALARDYSAIIFRIARGTRQTTTPDADILTHRHRKRLKHVATFIIEGFDSQTQMMKKQVNQIGQTIQSPLVARTAQSVGKDSGTFNGN